MQDPPCTKAVTLKPGITTASVPVVAGEEDALLENCTRQRASQVPCGPVLAIAVKESFSWSGLLQLDHGSSKKRAWAGASAYTL